MFKYMYLVGERAPCSLGFPESELLQRVFLPGLLEKLASFSENMFIVYMLKLLGIKCSRGTRLTFNLFLLVLVWLHFNSLDLGANFRFGVRAFPWWCLISLGCYALVSVGFELARVRDCPEEAQQLDQEIKEAKEFLTKKGLNW